MRRNMFDYAVPLPAGMSLLEQCEYRYWRTEVLCRLLLLIQKPRSLAIIWPFHWMWRKSCEGWINAPIYKFDKKEQNHESP